MPLVLVEGDIAEFQINGELQGCSQLIFKDALPNAEISLFSIAYPFTLTIRKPRNFTEEMFQEKYGKYQDVIQFIVYADNGPDKLNLKCDVTLCNKRQYALLCEFIAKITEESSPDFWGTLKTFLPSAREYTPEEIAFDKELESLNESSYEKLLLEAQRLCSEKEEVDDWSCDALWMLGQACLDKQLFNEAYKAMLLISEDNWYRVSADFQLTNRSLENIEVLSGLDMEAKHEKLKSHLIGFFEKNLVEGRALASLSPLIVKLLEFANCTLADLSCSIDELNDFDTMLLQFSELHYHFQKKNPTFTPEVSFTGLFSEKSNEESEEEVVASSPEKWQIEGDIQDFVQNSPDYKSLVFVNQSTSPRFSQIKLEKYPINLDKFDLYRYTIELYFSLNQQFMKEMHDNIDDSMFVFVHSGKEKFLRTRDGQFREEQLKKIYGFLQNKIPEDILQTLTQCIVARKPTDEEKEFDLEFAKLDGEGKHFLFLLEQAKKLCAMDDGDHGEALFRLGETCLALRLLENAYQTFYHITSVYYKTQAHLAMSRILLDRIQIDPYKTEEENHQQIGESLRAYYKVSKEKDFDDEAWGLNIEKLRMYAGLALSPTSRNEEVSCNEDLGLLELLLELAERIYLLKANKAQPKNVEKNKSNLMLLSPQGKQVAYPKAAPPLFENISLEDVDKKTDKDKMKKTDHWCFLF